MYAVSVSVAASAPGTMITKQTIVPAAERTHNNNCTQITDSRVSRRERLKMEHQFDPHRRSGRTPTKSPGKFLPYHTTRVTSGAWATGPRGSSGACGGRERGETCSELQRGWGRRIERAIGVARTQAPVGRFPGPGRSTRDTLIQRRRRSVWQHRLCSFLQPSVA